MKLLYFTTLAAGLCVVAQGADATVELKEKQDRISYALGMNMGMNLKRQGVSVKPELLIKGFQDALAGGQLLLTEAQLQETFTELNNEMREVRAAKQKEAGERNLVEGKKFLDENAKKEGIKTTVSGLQYKVVSEGSGPSPKATDRVSVKYTGKLVDGTVFDSTDKQGGAPATFRVDGVIKGWTEALQMMKKGAKWELYIPGPLAYGERGQGPQIQPNAVLIFEVELVDIIPNVEQPAQPVTSDIIKVPSADELKKGAKIEVLKPEDVQREIEKQKAAQQPK